MQKNDGSNDWTLLIVLGCLGVAVYLLSFGLGFVNLLAEEATTKTPIMHLAGERTSAELGSQASKMSGGSQANLPKALLVEIEELKQKLIHEEEELDRIKRDLANVEAEAQLKRQLAAQASTDRNKRKETGRGEQQEKDLLKQQLAEAEANLAKLRKDYEDRNAVDAATIFGGSSLRKKPQWVDCINDAVILQPQGVRISVTELKSKPSVFQDSLQTGYAVFLVRPDGFSSFQLARKLAVEKNITVGFEPVDTAWVMKYR